MSALSTTVLLLAYAFWREAIWLLGATAATLFAGIVTLIFCIVLKPGLGVGANTSKQGTGESRDSNT